MQQQITLYPPTRETMRMIFEVAIQGAQHPNTKQQIAEAYNYFEVIWMQEDQRRTEDDSKKPVKPPTRKSAMEEHGINSKQAQAKRNARKAKRAASSQKATEATESVDSGE